MFQFSPTFYLVIVSVGVTAFSQASFSQGMDLPRGEVEYRTMLQRTAAMERETAQIRVDIAKNNLRASLAEFGNLLNSLRPPERTPEQVEAITALNTVFSGLVNNTIRNRKIQGIATPVMTMIGADLSLNALSSKFPIRYKELEDAYRKILEESAFGKGGATNAAILVILNVVDDPVTPIQFDKLDDEEKASLWDSLL